MTLRRTFLLCCLSGLLWLVAPAAHAADGCAAAARGTSLASRIAAAACREHALWYSPFIDIDGRLASMAVAEAEAAPLADGTATWQRVAGYWRGSGLLAQMAGFEGASQCMYPAPGSVSAWCRSFIIDRPWSAAFLSWVMLQARLPGFRPSASHVDYVRAAYSRPGDSPFRFVDPDLEPAASGDLLCFVRADNRAYGHAGLRAFLDQDAAGGLPMHCDVVVGADRDRGRLHLVGGNVLQGVTMRILPINRQGLPWNLPRGSGRATNCWPANPAGCNFNRQDWAVLLKLRPESELATLAPPPVPVQPSFLPPTPALPSGQACCVHCVVGSGVPRCPSPATVPPSFPPPTPALPSGQACCVRCVVGSGVPRCPSPATVPPPPGG